MKRNLTTLWSDDCGALLMTEWLILASLIVLGTIPGLVALRNGTLHELLDFSNATASLDPSYNFDGQEVGCANCDLDEDRIVSMDEWTRGHDTARATTGKNGKDGSDVPHGVHHGRFEIFGTRDWGWVHDRRGAIAWTAGSSFLRGTHTPDGRVWSSGDKHQKLQPTAPESQVLSDDGEE
jgi:hypothetical protein